MHKVQLLLWYLPLTHFHCAQNMNGCGLFAAAELGQKPDLIIGNYSDGNLVASLLAHRMFVTQCNIAHALEKTKYQDADIKW